MRLGCFCNSLPWTLRTLKVWMVEKLVRKKTRERTMSDVGNDIKERDGSEHETMTRTLVILRYIDPCRVRMMEIDTCTRKKCVSGQMYCLRLPLRAGQLSLFGREIQKKTSTNQQLRHLNCWSLKQKMSRRRSCVDVDNFQLGVRNRASSFLMHGSTS